MKVLVPFYMSICVFAIFVVFNNSSFYLLPCDAFPFGVSENKYIQSFPDFQLFYEYVDIRNDDSPSELGGAQKERKRTRKVLFHSDKINFYKNCEVSNDAHNEEDGENNYEKSVVHDYVEDYPEENRRNCIRTDGEGISSELIQNKCAAMGLRIYDRLSQMLSWCLPHCFNIGNGFETTHLGFPDSSYFGGKRILTCKDHSEQWKLDRQISKSSDKWSKDGAEVEHSPSNELCQNSQQNLIQEIYEYEIYPFLKRFLTKNLHKGSPDVINKSETYFSDCTGGITSQRKENIQVGEKMVLYHSSRQHRYDILNQSKGVHKKKKKKHKKRGKEKKPDGMTKMHTRRKNSNLEQEEHKNDIHIPAELNYVYSIKKKVLRNFAFANILKKYIHYKYHSNGLVKVGKDGTYRDHSEGKARSRFTPFLEQHYGKSRSREKTGQKKYIHKERIYFINKKAIIILDHLKKETSYLIVSYVIEEKTAQVLNFTEYHVPLKVPIYTQSFMDTLEEGNPPKQYEQDDGNLSPIGDKLHQKEDICNYNYGDNCMEYLKNLFLKTCKVVVHPDDDVNKRREFLHVMNPVERKFLINEHHKGMEERQTQLPREAKKWSEEDHQKIGYSQGGVATKWGKNNFLRLYTHLSHVKGFHSFHRSLFRVFQVYSSAFQSGKLNGKGTSQGGLMGKEGDPAQDLHMDKAEVRRSGANDATNSSNINNLNNARYGDTSRKLSNQVEYIMSTYAGSDSGYHYYLINYNNQNFILEVNANSELYGNPFVNNKKSRENMTDAEKAIIKNMKKYMKEGNNFSVYIDHMPSSEVYHNDCDKFNTIKWALILFFIPAWLLLNVVYIIYVQNVWRQMLNPLYRLMLSPSIIRLASYIMLLLFCMIQYPQNNSRYVEYTILSYMALNTMFNTIFYGNLILISKGYMITRGQFSKRDNLSLTLIISSIYILTSFNQLNVINDTPILIFINMSLLFVLVINILSIQNFLKLRLSFVRSVRMMDSWEESLKIKLSMYKMYLLIIVSFFSLEILLHLLKAMFNFLTGTVILIEYAFELIMWCCVLYVFRHRGNVLYFSLLYDNFTFNIMPLYVAKTSDDMLDMVNDKQWTFESAHFPIFILNPWEQTNQNYLSRMAVGWPLVVHYGKRYL
ncbi:conserved Plasmodium protein, unknown function [Plasmodium knowlesi strain H]|uniref:Uncharacterized protein n=3 Tax=Plasmodium knowlesi TaxID=5850 RepID=A0A5K1VTK9_PLAKH|nr:conserved Plasmodium protein, unknown function [Plasmodium knowlesi strain H]OTN65641.1 Uncharacterized protein PKNOH_S110106800 [Plasmodium knowlesi]CAA9989687.1 conserved Plasmodium protein, unknown function [Plasmodium knowlesi strain H]SBO22834.1 conserved Plasmodium protein, unknown function [Plasmodium knowlesi strain H]SBO23067.1 conserved Plasmodium protein, unknown function [Plasmodium knowlesi strain H]VVS79161.1 conserved Plasmodium protein, unknown function [Plasmodium knowlesi |eukprot:XP_002260411.1 hypothetical protein, conserved in Plasmodium species [Plasmodium knowlesi strain H]